MVKDKHGKTETKKRVKTMTDMDTEESEANKEGDVMASIGATVSKKDDKTDLRAILMEIKTSKKKTQQFEEVKCAKPTQDSRKQRVVFWTWRAGSSSGRCY